MAEFLKQYFAPEWLAYVVAALVHAKAPKDTDAALALPADGGTLADKLNERVAKIGEKISFRRFVRYAPPPGVKGVLVPYIHAGGKIGVLVELRGAGADTPEFTALELHLREIGLV